MIWMIIACPEMIRLWQSHPLTDLIVSHDLGEVSKHRVLVEAYLPCSGYGQDHHAIYSAVSLTRDASGAVG